MSQEKEAEMKKSLLSMLTAFAFLVSLPAASLAVDGYKYNGSVKSLDPNKSAIVFCPEKAEEKKLPAEITIELNKKDFETIQDGFYKAKNAKKPRKLWVNVKYQVKDGKNAAYKISIIMPPIGC